MSEGTTVLSTISAPTAVEAPAEAPAESSGVAAPSSTETPAAVAEPSVVEPSVDPDLELHKKFDAVARREAKARKFEAEIQQSRLAVKAEEQRFKAMIQEFEDDPVAWLQKNKKDPVEFVKRITEPVSESERRIRALEEERAADKRAREEAEQRAQEQAQKQQQSAVFRRFVEQTDPEKYPYMTARWEPNELHGAIGAMLNAPHDASDPRSPTTLEVFRSKYNRAPNDEEIREALEAQAESYATRFSKASEKRQSLATPTSPSATGLSSQHASQSAGGSTRTRSRDETMRALREQAEAERSG